MQRRSSRLDLGLILAFLAMIGLPLFDQTLRPELQRNAVVEYRSPHENPGRPRTWEELQEYPRKVDLWYADAFGMRDRLVRWHNIVKWFGFRVSPTRSLVRGKGDWIFYTEARTMENFRGVDPMSERELEAWREMLTIRRDWLADRGIHYVYVIVPNKTEVYDDWMPARFDRVGAGRREQFFEYMTQHSDLHVVDLLPAMKEARLRDEDPYYAYLPLGTHWTDRGVYYGYAEIARELQRYYPDVEPWPWDAFECREGHDLGDSWAGRMYMEDLLEQSYPVLVANDQRPSQLDRESGLPIRANRWVHEDQDLPRCLFIHDSFGPPLVNFLAQHFSELHSYWQGEFEAGLVEKHQPDIVIQMYVDRSLVTTSPAPSGIEAADWLRDKYETSRWVRYRMPVSMRATPLEPFGGARIGWEEPVNEDELPGYVVVTEKGQDMVYLPTFELPEPGEGILQIDLTAERQTWLDLFYQTSERPEYHRDQCYRYKIERGRNQVFLNLAAPGIEGRLLLRPGRQPGRYVIHGVELRDITR